MLSSAFIRSSSSLDWMIGGYYTHERGLIRQECVAVKPGTLTPITTLPAGTVTCSLAVMGRG